MNQRPCDQQSVAGAYAGWMDWFSHTRLHSALDYRTPAEVETEHYLHQHDTAERPLAAQPTLY